MAALVISLPAAGAAGDELAVVGVEFSPPAQPLSQERLRELVMIDLGAPLNTGKVRDAIKNLYRTGRYENVQATRQRLGGGVKITFLTEPSWFVGLVRVIAARGSKLPLGTTRLVNATGLKLGRPWIDEDIAFAQEAIRKLLHDNGFFLSSVTVRTTPHTETQQKDVTFEILPGAPATFGKVYLSGNTQPVDPPLTPDRVRAIAGWKADKKFNQERLQKGIDRLETFLRERDYWQAQVRYIDHEFNPDKNQADVVLGIQRGPRILVRAEGESFSAKQLRRYVPIYEEGAVDEDLLREGARNLRDYLQTQGYFSARVTPLREREDDDEILIVYQVERGPRQRLVAVEISGHRFFDTATIRERMLVEAKTLDLRRGRYSQTLLQRDRTVIEDLYRSNGFREVKVSSRVTENYRGREGDMAVFIDIQEGPPTRISVLRILGAENIPEAAFRDRLASVEGQAFSQVSVASDRDLILGEYFDSGYHDADLVWRVAEAEEPNRVILEYEIREGDTLRVRRPIVSGLRRTRRSLVDRQVRIVPGEPLSANAMFETQRRLYELGIFSRVDVQLQNPGGDERSKNVLVQVEEARRWTAGIGGGAEFARLGGNTGDVTSPLGEATFSPRITLEATRLNMRGLGHTMSVRTRFSNLQQRALFTYEAPRWMGSDRWHMTLSGLLDTSRNVRTFTGKRIEGALQLRERLSKPSTLLYRFTYRRTSIDEDTLQITPLLIPLASQPVRVGLLSVTYIQDRRDDPTDSTKGIFNSLDLGFASGIWASEPDFVRVLGQNSTYHRLGRSRVIIARTLQIGMMIPTGTFKVSPEQAFNPLAGISDPDARIPLAERFFAGGANSHRGFPVNQAGPRDPTTGFPIGGGALFLNSVELRFPLRWESIGGVLFHDAGNIFSKPGAMTFRKTQQPVVVDNEVSGYDFDYMVHAVGLGVRYRTPIGPLRFDVAYGLNPPRFIGFEGTREDLLRGAGTISRQRISRFQFHFSVGQTF